MHVTCMTALTGSVFPKQQRLQCFLSSSSLESNQDSSVQPEVYNELLSSMLISFLVYFFCFETDNQEKKHICFSEVFAALLLSLWDECIAAHSVEEVIWNRGKYKVGK